MRLSKRPNVLLLMADQFRADCMGVEGNKAIRTPNIDRIANEGIRFRRAYSCTPTCTPARAALLTGLSPWHHGMLGYGRVAETYATELPRLMQSAGYFTAAIGKCHYHPQRNLHGFQLGLLDESGREESIDFRSDYHCWFRSVSPALNPDQTGIGWNDHRAKAYALPENLHPTFWTADTAVRLLSDYSLREPLFLKVSFARPHSPYDPPERFMRQYADESLPAAIAGSWAGRFTSRSDSSNDLWHGDLGRVQVRLSRQGYYGSISFLDEQIGRILEVLEKKGMMEDTLIVFTADHGDMLGDHHLWRKSYAYESSARIPMLLRCPTGLVSGARGRVLDQPVELRDILPTFLDAAAASLPDRLDGQSLLHLCRNSTDGWRAYIDLEHDVCYSRENHWNALADGRFKYIFHARDGEEQLFNLELDPHETIDLSSSTDQAGILRTWRERMVQHLAERGERFVKAGRLMPRPESYLYSPNYPGCSCHPLQRVQSR